MNKLLVVLFFFVIHTTFSQEYNFDYSTAYEYRLRENDSVQRKYIVLANSLTEDYVLLIREVVDTLTTCLLYDFTKNKVHELNNLFELKESRLMNMQPCIDYQVNKYSMAYVDTNGKKSFNIKRYKNKKKNKLVNQSYYFTKPSDITKNQHFSFPTLIFPLRCEKFKLENNEIITEAHFVENNQNLHFYNLVDLKRINFKIKIEN